MLSDRWNMGFGQGYAVYQEDEARGHDTVSTGGVTDRAIAELAALSRANEPFLLFVHYFDPHFEYRGHDDVDFAGEASERLDGQENIVALREKLDSLDAGDFAFLRDRYDEEIRHTDAGIGRLLEALRESGHDADTVVALTSDHGEELGEKGWIGHTRTLYEFVLRVPLIVRVPSDPGGRVIDTPVSLVSLTPSLLDLVGVSFASDSFHGRSFAAAVQDGESVDRTQEVFAEIDFPLQDPRISPVRLRKRALIGERYKLILDDEAASVALYDLASDPEERRDLSAVRPELRERMLAALHAQAGAAREGGPPAEAVPLTREELEVLEKLGYVETAPRSTVSPDPRP
jgi:arylsulfatase A-like enzyme